MSGLHPSGAWRGRDEVWPESEPGVWDEIVELGAQDPDEEHARVSAMARQDEELRLRIYPPDECELPCPIRDTHPEDVCTKASDHAGLHECEGCGLEW